MVIANSWDKYRNLPSANHMVLGKCQKNKLFDIFSHLCHDLKQAICKFAPKMNF